MGEKGHNARPYQTCERTLKDLFLTASFTEIMYLPKGADEHTCAAIVIHFDEYYPRSKGGSLP
jgi:hypothetical protein